MAIELKNIFCRLICAITLFSPNVFAESNYPKTKEERKNDEMGSLLQGGGIIFTHAKSKNESTKQHLHCVNKYLWQASIEILSFAPLASVDSNSGIIITDWYSPKDNPKYSFKINAIIKDDVISPNAITVKIFKKLLKNNKGQEIDEESELASILEDKILRKARELYINAERKN
jgi:hypothetical protein